MICFGVVIAKTLRFVLMYDTWGFCQNIIGKKCL